MNGSSIKPKPAQPVKKHSALKNAFSKASLYGAVFGTCALALGLAVSFGRAVLGDEPAPMQNAFNVLQSAFIFGAGAASSVFAMNLSKGKRKVNFTKKAKNNGVVGFRVPSIKNHM